MSPPGLLREVQLKLDRDRTTDFTPSITALLPRAVLKPLELFASRTHLEKPSHPEERERVCATCRARVGATGRARVHI